MVPAGCSRRRREPPRTPVPDRRCHSSHTLEALLTVARHVARDERADFGVPDCHVPAAGAVEPLHVNVVQRDVSGHRGVAAISEVRDMKVEAAPCHRYAVQSRMECEHRRRERRIFAVALTDKCHNAAFRRARVDVRGSLTRSRFGIAAAGDDDCVPTVRDLICVVE